MRRRNGQDRSLQSVGAALRGRPFYLWPPSAPAVIASRRRHCGLDPQSPATTGLNPSGQTQWYKTEMARQEQSPCPTVPPGLRERSRFVGEIAGQARNDVVRPTCGRPRRPRRPPCHRRARCPHRAALRRRNGQDRSLQSVWAALPGRPFYLWPPPVRAACHAAVGRGLCVLEAGSQKREAR